MHYDQVNIQTHSIWTESSNNHSLVRSLRSFDELDLRDYITSHNAKWKNDQISDSSILVKPHKVVIEKAAIEESSDDIDIEVW
jgi:hypothetical protein